MTARRWTPYLWAGVCFVALSLTAADAQAKARRVNIIGPVGGSDCDISFTVRECDNDPFAECGQPIVGGCGGITICSVTVSGNVASESDLAMAIVNAINSTCIGSGVSATDLGGGVFDVFFPENGCLCLTEDDGVTQTSWPLARGVDGCDPPFLCGFRWLFIVDDNPPPEPPCLEVTWCTLNDPGGAQCDKQFTVSNCGGTSVTEFYLDVEAGDGGPVTPATPLNDLTIASPWVKSICFQNSGLWSETATRAHAIFRFTGGSLAPGASVTGTLSVLNTVTQRMIPGTAHVVPAGGIHTHVTPRTPADLGTTCGGGGYGPHVAGQAGEWSAESDSICGTTCAAQPGDVIVTEIMYNPGSNEGPPFPTLTEWVEIWNTTGLPIDLTGWYLADEDGRSGEFESFVLPANGIAVIIPRGSGDPGLAPLLAKADFTSAWGTPMAQLVQPTITNDKSGPRDGTTPNAAEGGIIGSGLSSNPSRDGNDANDLLNTPFGTPPCPYGSATYCADPIPDSEVLLLVRPDGDPTENDDVIIDKVNFDDTGVWPVDNNVSSIVLDETQLDPIGNDNGANWDLAVIGVDRAIAATTNSVFTFADIGSPGQIETITVGNQPPFAGGESRYTNPSAQEVFTLLGLDDGDGMPPGTLNYIIDTVPTQGVLRYVPTNSIVGPGFTVNSTTVAAGPEFRYENNGMCGSDSFTFHTSDGSLTSGTGTITLIIQCGEIVITEIMYNPASTEPSTPKETEWLEVYNPSGSPLDVSGWRVADRTGRTGEFPTGSIIPANSVAVIIAGGGVDTTPPCDPALCPGMTGCDAGDRLFVPAEFTAAWGAITTILQPDIFALTCDATDTSFGNVGGGGLGNDPFTTGEEVRLVDDSDVVQDVASYDNAAPWPAGATLPLGASIYLMSGGMGNPNYNAAANDLGANWDGSDPEDESGAYNNTIVGSWDASDQGSPGFLAGVSVGNTRPTPLGRLNTMMSSIGGDPRTLNTTLIVLDSTPTGTLNTIINSLPIFDRPGGAAAGTLTDAGNSHVILVGELPYTLVGGGSTVIYTPTTNLTGAVAFTFSGTDGMLTSGVAKQRVAVQGRSVAITEIMFNPANLPDNDWEWIEMVNTSGSAVTVASIRAGTDTNIGTVGSDNTNTFSLAAGQRALLVNANSEALFGSEWSLSGMQLSNDVVFVSGVLWDVLAAPGGVSGPHRVIRLYDASEGLLDQVIYEDNLDGWPNYFDQGPSVYLREGFAGGSIRSEFNDAGENWGVSAPMCDGAVLSNGADMVQDTGSPLVASTSVEDDCNNNGIPDSCDLTSGVLTDNAPMNGIPDECELFCATCRGDLNGDNKYNGDDIRAFVDAYVDAQAMTPVYSPCADVTGNLLIDINDLDSFLDLLVDEDTSCNRLQITISKSGTTVAGTLTLGIYEARDPAAMPPETADACGVLDDCPTGIVGIDICSVSVSVLASDSAAVLATKLSAAINLGTGECFQQMRATNVSNVLTLVHENPREKVVSCLSSSTNDNPAGQGYNIGGASNCAANNYLDNVASNGGVGPTANGFHFAGLQQN